jgi:hypothetical protein
LSSAVNELTYNPPADKQRQNELAEKSGLILSSLLGTDMATEGTETSLELNLFALKVKHTIKRGKNK